MGLPKKQDYLKSYGNIKMQWDCVRSDVTTYKVTNCLKCDVTLLTMNGTTYKVMWLSKNGWDYLTSGGTT
jgi:hypothetical protein